MSTITLKDVPPATHESLKRRARAHGRSLNKEIVAMLDSMLHGAAIDAKAVGARARAVRETMGVYLTQEELSRLKDTGRQ